MTSKRQERPTARISAYWNERAKRWDLVASGSDSHQSWTWTVSADSQVEIDAGTGWLLMQSCKEALEAQLI